MNMESLERLLTAYNANIFDLGEQMAAVRGEQSRAARPSAEEIDEKVVRLLKHYGLVPGEVEEEEEEEEEEGLKRPS